MEEGNAKGEPDAHDPVLDARGHISSIEIPELDGDPVHVQQDDGAKREGQATNAEDGHVSLLVEEDHTADDNSRPDDGEAAVEDAEAVQAEALSGSRPGGEVDSHDVGVEEDRRLLLGIGATSDGQWMERVDSCRGAEIRDGGTVEL